MNRRIAIVAMLVLLATTALAQREGCLWWGYHHADNVPESWLGVSKATVYETAIHVGGNATTTQGGTISAVRLPFNNAEHIDSLTLWLTTTLGSEDLASVFVGKPQAGWNVIDLPKVVAIPDTGLYVGFTFRVTELDGMSERPLVMCNTYADGGLWLRVANVKAYSEWYNTKRFGSLALQLELSGPDVAKNSVSVDAIQNNNVVAQTQDSLQVAVTTYGTEAVSSLQYDYAFGDEQHTGTCALPRTMPRVWGAQDYFSVPLQAPVATGRMTLAYTLTGVNGTTNQCQQKTASAQVLSLQRKPHHRTVMEEYTGTWCSACPRGFAGIARLKKMYPDDFIAVSVHILNGDPMDVYYDYYYVINATQFPSCRFDRGAVTDPYDGDVTDGHFHADQNFRAANAILAPADLTVSAQWTTDSVCSIESNTTFVYDDKECRYQLVYIMVEDSLRGPEGDHQWHQKNSFNDPSMAYYVEDDMQQYVNAEGMMLDHVAYNDVVISMSDVRGISGSLSGPQVAEAPMKHQYELRRTAVSQNRDNIHIVCLLVDTETKRVANAAICPVSAPASVQGVAAKTQHTSQAYDLQGRHTTGSHKGLLIVRRADGSVRKTMNK